MIRLRIGYLFTGIVTGFILLVSFLTTIPDGKLHVVFCDVGQGDGIYIRFPDGKDMVIDGGPASPSQGGSGTKIISCLSRHMPFWDRAIDVVVLTHPQRDHMDGLISVLERYTVSYMLRSDVATNTEGFATLKKRIAEKKVIEKFAQTGEVIDIGAVHLSILWPSTEQIASMKPRLSLDSRQTVLGASIDPAVKAAQNVNDASIVLSLSYGSFDALFPGDADSRIQPKLLSAVHSFARDGVLDLLKVPHHGSKAGMTDQFLQEMSFKTTSHVKPESHIPLAVISVGKNSYGHPAPEALSKLEQAGFTIQRTDKKGDIEVVSDGRVWSVKK